MISLQQIHHLCHQSAQEMLSLQNMNGKQTSLASAASNAQIEGDDSPNAALSATSRVFNYTQISYKPVMVSGTQEAVDHAGS